MGAAAAGAADVVIITDDNPRNEEPGDPGTGHGRRRGCSPDR